MTTAVMISNMGGPDSLESVEAYLFNIFKDPDIIDIPLPERLRMRFVRWLAKKRAPESREIYNKIGGKTPLTDITRKQASGLEKALNNAGNNTFKVFTAMRYWDPFVEDVWQQIVREGFDRLIVVTLYPFYSTTTTGSLESLIGRLNKDGTFSDENLLFIDRYGHHPKFIGAMAEQIKTALAGKPDRTDDKPVNLLCSAHSIPLKRVKAGDPYRDEVVKATRLLENELPDNVNVHLCFQSKIGPIKWVEPATPDTIEELAAKGIKELWAYPLGFVADNSETIYEIGMLYKDLAHDKGIEHFYRIDALNDSPLFIEALSTVILEQYNSNFGQ